MASHASIHLNLIKVIMLLILSHAGVADTRCRHSTKVTSVISNLFVPGPMTHKIPTILIRCALIS